MKNNIYTLFYSCILGIVCASLLTVASEFTRPYKNANEKAELVTNMLAILKVPVPDDAALTERIEIFETNVAKEEKGELTIYSYRQPGQVSVQAAAFSFSGPGLWGPIEGFLALESDLRTIRGISFYKQEETPGLGGEIASDWFQLQFVGKSIVDQSGNPGIIISKNSGQEAGQNQVDAITGATMTCDLVEDMLNKVIKTIVEEQD